MSSCGMGGFKKSGGSGASSSPWSHQSRTCQGWVLQAQLQRACISPATTLFIGVWGTAEGMSFPRIIQPCLYLRGFCCSSTRRRHRISSVTGCSISADEVLTTASRASPCWVLRAWSEVSPSRWQLSPFPSADSHGLGWRNWNRPQGWNLTGIAHAVT